MKAIQQFENLEKGILYIIQAADLYAIHHLARSRKEEPDHQLIQNVVEGRLVSTLTVLGVPYTEKERKELEEKGALQSVGNQIVLATYTALECYLASKFEEYLQFHLKSAGGEMAAKISVKLSSRNLNDSKDLYRNILGIYLTCFEINKNFMRARLGAKNSWEILTMIEESRNQIAHRGKSESYKIKILPDAWELFDFVRRWVSLFDVNFDFLIYEGRTTDTIKEYKRKVAGGNRQGKGRSS